MEIVSGKARGILLTSPPDDAVRPTSVRARRALFDSLGELHGKVFADICAGSGAMGLEAASRGARAVILVEQSRKTMKMIEQNCRKVQKTGVDADLHLLCGRMPAFSSRLLSFPAPDIVFADPPYAESMDLLSAITADVSFAKWASSALFYWELPDASFSLPVPADPWRILAIRQLGPARFLLLKANSQ